MTEMTLNQNHFVVLTEAELSEINGGGPILLAIGVAAVIGGAYLVGYGVGYVMNM